MHDDEQTQYLVKMMACLVGKTITEVGTDGMFPFFTLSDGRTVQISQDPEGNGPGYLFNLDRPSPEAVRKTNEDAAERREEQANFDRGFRSAARASRRRALTSRVKCPGCVKRGVAEPALVKPGYQCTRCADLRRGGALMSHHRYPDCRAMVTGDTCDPADESDARVTCTVCRSDLGLPELSSSEIVAPAEPTRLPRGFREDRDTGQLACPHRDITCCDDCAKLEGVVEVAAQHFWIPDPAERADLKKLQTELASKAADEVKS